MAFITIITQAKAQATCNGSLGDPVINQNFGAGPNPGTSLAPGITNMTYTANNSPEDGFYTIANSLVGAADTHPYTWHNVTADHTGNPNGYMMIINAGYQPSVFFTQTANGLCPNTLYEFSAYILNLMIPSPITVTYSHPNITFTVQTTSGLVLATTNTGSIPAYAAPTWYKYSTSFTMPANVTDVVVVMTNNAPGGNGNDFILDDIAFRACGPIIQEGFSSVTGPASQTLCQGTNATFTLKAQVIGNGKPAYQWQSGNVGSGWADIAGANSNSLTVPFVNAVPGEYQYRLGVANGSAITDVGCRVYSPPLTVTVNPLPVVPLFAPQNVCDGGQLLLSATGGATYTWTGPNLPPTAQNPLIINNVTSAAAGVYTVVAVSGSGCLAAPATVGVTVVPKIVPGISNNTSVCAGESTQLSASGGVFYKWSPSAGLSQDNIPNPVATPLQTTTYTVQISNVGCTDNSKSVTVTVIQNPVANAGSEIILFEGQSAKLNGSVKGDNITGYLWTPATFLSDPTSLTPTTIPTDDITYTLTATSKTCGTASSTVFVRVYKKITIPNTFSPNHDGINDFWNIDALVTYPQSSVLVFDRYGQQVYQSTGYARPWDGALNGKGLPDGAYYYLIDLKNSTPKLTGWVLIVR